jgi:hypothetical protein
MNSPFRNLTEPLIETPRERRAPDCVGMNVRLDGAGTTDGSGRFVSGGSARSRGGKSVKSCMARLCRIVRHLRSEISRSRNKHALRLFEIARVLVRLDHVATRIVNADHGIV